MARIRTLKPEVWQHEKLGRITRDERLLFVVLITMADDAGRLRDLLPAIRGHGYPHDRFSDRQLDRWLAALERERLITRYGCGRERFIVLRGWHKHQRIDRARASLLPPPDGFSAQEQGTLAVDSTNDRRSLDGGSGTKDHDQGSGSLDLDQEDPPDPPASGGASTWASVCDVLRGQLTEFTFHTWIEPIEPVSLVDGRLVVRAPDHVRSWVEDSFMVPIAEAATRVGVVVELEQPVAQPRRRRRAA